MIRHRVKSYTSIVLFVAMLFAFGNLAHSLEHDYGLGASQTHAECNHCSGEHSAAVSPLTLMPFASLSVFASARMGIQVKFVLFIIFIKDIL